VQIFTQYFYLEHFQSEVARVLYWEITGLSQGITGLYQCITDLYQCITGLYKVLVSFEVFLVIYLV